MILTTQVNGAEDLLRCRMSGVKNERERCTYSRRCVARDRDEIAYDTVLEEHLPHRRTVVPAHETDDVKDQKDKVEPESYGTIVNKRPARQPRKEPTH